MRTLCDCCDKDGAAVSYYQNMMYLSCSKCKESRAIPSYVVSAGLYDHTEEEVKREWFKLVGGKYKLLKDGKELTSADDLYKEATWMIGFEREMILGNA